MQVHGPPTPISATPPSIHVDEAPICLPICLARAGDVPPDPVAQAADNPQPSPRRPDPQTAADVRARTAADPTVQQMQYRARDQIGRAQAGGVAIVEPEGQCGPPQLRVQLDLPKGMCREEVDAAVRVLQPLSGQASVALRALTEARARGDKEGVRVAMGEIESFAKALPGLFRERFEKEVGKFYDRIQLTNPELGQMRREWMYSGLRGQPTKWEPPSPAGRSPPRAPIRPESDGGYSALREAAFLAWGVVRGKTAAVASWSPGDTTGEKLLTLAIGAIPSAGASLFVGILLGGREAGEPYESEQRRLWGYHEAERRRREQAQTKGQ